MGIISIQVRKMIVVEHKKIYIIHDLAVDATHRYASPLIQLYANLLDLLQTLFRNEIDFDVSLHIDVANKKINETCF